MLVRRLLTASLVLLALTACADESQPPGPGAGARVVADYFPMREGATWTYRVTLGEVTYEEMWRCREVGTAGAGAPRTFLVGWEQRFPGTMHDSFTPHFESVDHYIVSADGSHVAQHMFATDLGYHPVPGWKAELEEDEISWILRSDAKPGATIEKREISRSGIERVGTYAVLGVDERVSVPAGTFTRCLHVQREVDVSERRSGRSGLARRKELVEAWFAPHVGLVKRGKRGPGTGDEEIRVLIAFRVD